MAGENGGDSWVVQVKRLLTEKTETKAAIPRLPRLPRPMVSAMPEAYIPQILSLGPYHHRTLKDNNEGTMAASHRSDICLMETHKIKSARDALDPAKSDQAIDRLYHNIMEHRDEFEKFYYWNIDRDIVEVAKNGDGQNQNFWWMIIIDALFLFKLLKVGFDHPAEHSSVHPPREPHADPPAMATVRCDIVKLENQIPLFVLRELERALRTNTSDEEKLDDFVRKRISTHLSCFEVYPEDMKEVAIEHHLLGCMHTYVSSFLEIQNGQNRSHQLTLYERISTCFGNGVACVARVIWPLPVKDGKHDFLSRYNAEELLKAGIKIKSFQQLPRKITFDKHSETLFLPPIIVIDTYSEVMLRNLLALEFYDANPVKHVTRYVELMDCLIDTPEDVRLLIDRGVIVRKSMMITYEDVARMWNGMCKPFFAAFLEPPPQMKEEIKEVLIKNYYKTKIKTKWQEFRKEYLSSPWKAVALFVGIFVLLLDVTQTYCSFRECTPKSRQSMESPTPTRKHFTAFGGV